VPRRARLRENCASGPNGLCGRRSVRPGGRELFAEGGECGPERAEVGI
jgi:hypothetical protein